MNILITNDDGIHAPGLWTLVEAMQRVGRVTVVAPDREQSGVGASISLAKAIHMHKLTFSMEGVDTYAVEGTPGDAVILGLAQVMKDQPVDLVVSGVNHGHNTGTELFLSGTVGAALHARLRGITAIAVSAAYQTPYRGGGLFQIGADVASALAGMVTAQTAPQDALYNVNVPFCHANELKGIYLAKNSYGSYSDKVREEDDGRGRSIYHLIFGRDKIDRHRGTESWALEHNYIAVTLLDERLAQLPNKSLPQDFAARLTEASLGERDSAFVRTTSP